MHEKPPLELFVGVPAKPNQFIGRDEQYRATVDRLTAGGSVALSTSGQGGAGKTTLAVMLAYDERVHARFRDGVLWAGLGTQPDIARIQAEWGDALGLDLSTILDLHDRAKKLRSAISLRSLLIVIDDAWEADDANVLRCGGPNCSYLLTTRDDGIAREFAGAMGAQKVLELDEDYAFDLLRTLAPEACIADEAAARDLVRAVGGLPLAIELLGGYLADPKRTALAAARAEAFRELADPTTRLRLARERLGGDGSRVPLEQTIALSLNRLQEEVVKGFYSLGAFAPKPETFSVDAAMDVTGLKASQITELIGLNLLETADGERISIHQVLASFANDRMQEDALARHIAFYLVFVHSVRDDWRTIEREYGQFKHAWSALPIDAVDERIAFVYAVQDYQRRRGLWRDKVLLGETALRLAQREPRSRVHVGTLLNNLGMVYTNLGQRKKALEYYKRALPIRVEVGDRVGEAATLNNIGMVYNTLGQPQKALEYYERALPIIAEVGERYGEAVTLNNIGMVYSALEQWQKALEYYERALPILAEIGERDGEAVTLNNIGAIYQRLGQRQKALEYYERALSIRAEVGDRAGEAVTLQNIGSVYEALSMRPKALEYFERALPIFVEVGGRAEEAIARYNLAMVYRAEGQLSESVEQLRQVIKLDEYIQHPDLEQDRAMLREVEEELRAAEAGQQD